MCKHAKEEDGEVVHNVTYVDARETMGGMHVVVHEGDDGRNACSSKQLTTRRGIISYIVSSGFWLM